MFTLRTFFVVAEFISDSCKIQMECWIYGILHRPRKNGIDVHECPKTFPHKKCCFVCSFVLRIQFGEQRIKESKSENERAVGLLRALISLSLALFWIYTDRFYTDRIGMTGGKGLCTSFWLTERENEAQGADSVGYVLQFEMLFGLYKEMNTRVRDFRYNERIHPTSPSSGFNQILCKLNHFPLYLATIIEKRFLFLFEVFIAIKSVIIGSFPNIPFPAVSFAYQKHARIFVFLIDHRNTRTPIIYKYEFV